jgi:pyruvyltransferase
MPVVAVVYWNPRRSPLPRRLTARLPIQIGRPVNNFGDLLGPLVVDKLLKARSLTTQDAIFDRRLLTVGSILHFAQDGDVIWGTGVNGKKREDVHRFHQLDVRAVRGPRTRQFLLDRGIDAPAVFGDPALLLPELMPELASWAKEKTFPLTIVPNFNDIDGFDDNPDVLDPRSPVEVCLRRLAKSEFVVGSSLHAIVVAESLGIAARILSSRSEDLFKYDDYYLGTGRPAAEPARTVKEALAMGGAPVPSFDPQRLLDAFPFDLWLSD